MSRENSEIMQKARRGRDRLVSQLIHNPDVTLIDIGFPPDTATGYQTDEMVIRVHVRAHWFESRPEERPDIPDEIEGIRVVVIPGDYHLD